MCRTSSSSTSNFSEIPFPEDNQYSKEKAALGRQLFFDKRLSTNNTVSCASCHIPEYAFTDRLPQSEGVMGRRTERNSPTLLNAAFLKTVMFDAHLPTLEMQVIVPIQEHVEMDMKMGDLIKKLQKIPEYQEAAKKIFNRDFDPYVLTRSIATFERTLISQDSKFDRYKKGDKKALNKDELAGYHLFSEVLACTKCHHEPFFTNYEARNNGLYADYGKDNGRFRINNDSTDIGKFKVPTLRNIELTYPYMHDGSLGSLSDVIDHYAKGGEDHSNKDPLVKPFVITDIQKRQLISFLKALTDTTYMKDFR